MKDRVRGLLRRVRGVLADEKGINTIELIAITLVLVVVAVVAYKALGGTIATKTGQVGSSISNQSTSF